MQPVMRIDHVAIVVDDIEKALHFWRDALGLEVDHVDAVADQDSVVAFLSLENAEVELVKPISNNSGVARHLEKRGPGLHHICFQVEDIQACLEKLAALGVRLIHSDPVIGTGGKRIAFIHPESTHGVLVELYELSEEEPAIRLARARTLADRALDRGSVMAAGVLGFLRSLREPEDGTPQDERTVHSREG